MRPVWKPSRPTHGLKPTGGVLPAVQGARMHRDAGLSMHLLTGPMSVRSSSRHDRGATVGWAVPTDRASGRRRAVAGPLIDAVRCLLPVCRAGTGRRPWSGKSALTAPRIRFAAGPPERATGSPHPPPPARPWCSLGWAACRFAGARRSSPESIEW